MCTRIRDHIVICINSKSSYGRQRFTLAHELYHILYENKMDRVICGMSLVGNKSDSEKEADQFASYLLMPYDSLIQYGEKEKLLLDAYRTDIVYNLDEEETNLND